MSKCVYYVLQINVDETLTCYEVTAGGELLNLNRYASWKELPVLPAKLKLLVLLPGQWCHRMTVNLPKASYQDALKAAPYLIEEQVATPIEELHVVVEKQGNGEYLLLALELQKMEAVSAKLKEKALAPVAAMPDYFVLSTQAPMPSVWLFQHNAIVRTAETVGFSTSITQLPLALRLYAKEKSLPALQVYVTSTQGMTQSLQEKLAPVELVVHEKMPLFDVSALSQKPRINLLKGKYRMKRASAQKKNYWFYAFCAIGVWGLVFIATNVTSLIYLSHRNAALNNKINQVYQGLYPGQTSDDPASVIKQELASKQAPREDRFIKILGQVSQVLAKNPQLMLQSIQYQNNELTLVVQVKALESLTKFANQLQQRGLTLLQNQVTTGRHTVTGEIKVGEGKDARSN